MTQTQSRIGGGKRERGEQQQQRVAREIEPRFPHDDVAFVLGNPGQRNLAGQGMAKHQPLTTGELKKTGIGDRQLRIRGWFDADDQFRILVRILRIAMMVPVKQAVILVAMRDHESRQMAHGQVERATPERRFMGGLVHRHEQKGHQIGLHDDERQGPRQSVGRGDQPYHCPDDNNCAVMTDGANGAAKIRSRREFAQQGRT